MKNRTSNDIGARNTRALRLLTTAAVGLCLLLAAARANAQTGGWRKQYPKLRYGVQSVETQAASLTRYKGFKEYVKKKLGVELELFLASEYAGVIQAIGAKQIEVMDMGASGYAAAWVESKGGVEPLVVPTNNDGTIGYYAVAFVRSDSPYKTLADLKGKTWAWAEPNSSSGYLFPLVGLRKMGLEPEKHFGKVVFSGGHEQSIIGVLDKSYDGAVTWTDDVKKHSRGGLHMMLSRNLLKKEDIRIIWVSDLIPNPVIAIRSDLPQDMKADLKAMFLNLHKDDPKVFSEVARGESQGYKEVKHAAYQIAVDLRQQLASERRNRR
jgi:phosphonate transport system substrate-binding protein